MSLKYEFSPLNIVEKITSYPIHIDLSKFSIHHCAWPLTLIAPVLRTGSRDTQVDPLSI